MRQALVPYVCAPLHPSVLAELQCRGSRARKALPARACAGSPLGSSCTLFEHVHALLCAPAQDAQPGLGPSACTRAAGQALCCSAAAAAAVHMAVLLHAHLAALENHVLHVLPSYIQARPGSASGHQSIGAAACAASCMHACARTFLEPDTVSLYAPVHVAIRITCGCIRGCIANSCTCMHHGRNALHCAWALPRTALLSSHSRTHAMVAF